MHFFTDKNPILAYVSIGSELKQLQNIGWIASSYLLTITSVQYVSEDIESRKWLNLVRQALVRQIERYIWQKALPTFCIYRLCCRFPVVWPIENFDRAGSEQSYCWYRRRWNADVSLYWRMWSLISKTSLKRCEHYHVRCRPSSWKRDLARWKQTFDVVAFNLCSLLAVLNIFWASGNTVGASLGGYLTDTIGWRW